jgi:glycosyltransferase involved in cell wall biosynthesis
MRVALLTYRGNMFCGGQGIYAAHLAHELHRLGHQVQVIAGPPLPELESGIPLHVIPNENFFGRPPAEAIARDGALRALLPGNLWELALCRLSVFPEMSAFGMRLLVRWKRLQERHRFDVVLDNQSLCWGLLGIQAAGTPVVGVVHHPLHLDREADFALDPRFRTKWKRTLYFPMWMQERVVPRLARVLTVSHASAAEIERRFRLPRARIDVVHNGTDTKTFQPIERAKQIDFIFVGRTEDRKKGVVPLLEALARTPRPIRLKIVDGRITDDGLVARTLRRLRIEDRVVLERRLLPVPDLVAEYSTARAAVVPSYFEGFGFPASEAMACGLPVIASARGALPELVGSSGETGTLVPFGDVDALARAMVELARDPARAARMGERARLRIEHEFGWPRAGRETARVLEAVVRAHRRP